MLEETRRHFLRQKLFPLHIQVSVNICGHLNIGVTHVFLHIFQRESVVQEQAGTAVPKLMKADMRQVVVLQEKREMGRNDVHNSASLSFHVAIAFSRFLMTQLSLMVYTSHSQKVSREKSYDSIAKIVRLAYNMDEPNLDEKEESTMSITATELKQNLSKYLLMAEREDVFITRNGKVVAKLTNPYQDRVDMAKSLFGIIPGDMTIEQAHRERLETV